MPDPYRQYQDEYDADTNTFNQSLEHPGNGNTDSPINTLAGNYSQLFEGDDHSSSSDNHQLLTINSIDTGLSSRHIEPDHLVPRTHWYSDTDTGDYLLDQHSQQILEEEELELDTDIVGNDEDDDDDPYGEHVDQGSGEHMEMDSGDNGDRSMDDNEKETNAVQIYQSTHPDRDPKGGQEIANSDATWAVSTYRPDWGVEKMRDDNPLTYWQSDCQNPRAPHTVDIYFQRATFIKQISIFYDFYQDESYSPKEISIRGGTTYRDLHEIAKITCEETVGWKNVDLPSLLNEPLRVFQLQIAILSTYMNGKDVHIRQIKVYSVATPYSQETNEANGEYKIHPIKYKGLR